MGSKVRGVLQAVRQGFFPPAAHSSCHKWSGGNRGHRGVQRSAVELKGRKRWTGVMGQKKGGGCFVMDERR